MKELVREVIREEVSVRLGFDKGWYNDNSLRVSLHLEPKGEYQTSKESEFSSDSYSLPNWAEDRSSSW